MLKWVIGYLVGAAIVTSIFYMMKDSLNVAGAWFYYCFPVLLIGLCLCVGFMVNYLVMSRRCYVIGKRLRLVTIGDLLAGRADAREREISMGKARQELDWEKQFSLSLFPDIARSIHGRDEEKETCSMCGDLCAVKMVRDLFTPPRKSHEP